MFRKLLIGAAAAAALLSANPTAVFAQPPTPPQIVRQVDHDVRHALGHTNRAVRHAAHHVNRRVRSTAHRATHRRARALCNDGRVHVGRTRVTACANHGGLKG